MRNRDKIIFYLFHIMSNENELITVILSDWIIFGIPHNNCLVASGM